MNYPDIYLVTYKADDRGETHVASFDGNEYWITELENPFQENQLSSIKKVKYNGEECEVVK